MKRTANTDGSVGDFPTFRVFFSLAVVVLMFIAVVVIYSTVHFISKQGDVSGADSAVVAAGLHGFQTGRIYTDIDSYPYTAPAYGPLLYLALEVLAYFSHGEFWPVMLAGRFIVFAAFLLLGPLIYLCARRVGSSGGSSALGALAVLSMIDFELGNVSVRPDVPALALGLLALYFALPNQKIVGDFSLAASGLCIAAEILIKQSMITAGLSIALWLLSRREFRKLAIFAGVVVLPIAGIVGVLSLDQPVIATMWLLRYAPKDLGTAIYVAMPSLAHSVFLLAFGIGGLLFGRGERAGLRLLQIYFVISWVLSPLMMLQVGADTNYLLEGWAACALLTPPALESMRSSWPLFARWSRLALLCCVFLAAGLIGLRFRRADYVHEYPNAVELQHMTVLSDIGYLSAHGNRPELLDPYMNHSLEVTGHWSPQPIIANLERQYYDVAFVRTINGAVASWRGVTFLDGPILNALNEKYDLLCLGPSAAVLVPRNRRTLDVHRASEILNENCAVAPARSLASAVQLSPHEPPLAARYYGRLRRLLGRKTGAD